MRNHNDEQLKLEKKDNKGVIETLSWKPPLYNAHLEDEHVSPFWNGTHVDGVEDLVIIFALRGAHVYYFPLQI